MIDGPIVGENDGAKLGRTLQVGCCEPLGLVDGDTVDVGIALDVGFSLGSIVTVGAGDTVGYLTSMGQPETTCPKQSCLPVIKKTSPHGYG